MVAVLRTGAVASILRLRGSGDGPEDLLTGADLAPNLAAALAETLLDSCPKGGRGRPVPISTSPLSQGVDISNAVRNRRWQACPDQ